MKAARFIAVIVLVSLPVFSMAEAQRSRQNNADPTASGELGYVSGDGIVLSPHTSFVTAAQAVSGAADKAYARWKTCMSGMDLGMAFKLSRAAFAQYQRNPARFCGPEPRDVSAKQAESFQLREALYSISEGRRIGNVLATFAFTSGSDEIVQGSDKIGGRCLVLTNSSGSPIAVRSTRDSDPYTFANPYNKVDDPVLRYQAQAQDLADRLNTSRSQLSYLQDQLAGSRAWQGRQCVRPASGALPARPAVMSDAAISSAAKGFCTDMSMRRIPKSEVLAALRSNYMDDYITAQTAWERGSKPQCAMNIRSQVEDQLSLWMVRYGPTMGGYGMIQDNILKCEAIARNSCRAPLAAWESRVSAIKAGPQAELNQCQSLVSQISQRQSEVASLSPQLDQARANLVNAQAMPRTQPQTLPLSQARCR